MWFGYRDDIREIPTARRGLELVTAMNVAEHVGLSGAVRTTSRRNTPRRWRMNWEFLDDVSADWIRHCARRLSGPGPFVVLDPSTRNYLAPLQSLGRGRGALWNTTVGSVAGPTYGPIIWTRTGSGDLSWVHPLWTRWPVAPGLVVSFGHAAPELPAGLVWYSAVGGFLSFVADPSGTVTATAPAGARWVAPYLSATGAGTLAVPRACLRYGSAVGGSSTWPAGEHTGALGIVAHSETVLTLPRRTVSLELVEY